VVSKPVNVMAKEIKHGENVTYLLTYLNIPRNRISLEKLTGSQLVKKLPAFYETRRFITAIICARHLSLT